MSDLRAIQAHVRSLSRCEKCPAMHKPVVSGKAVASRIILVGQAPGVKEPVLGRPFAWTAGKTLFRWLDQALGWDEETVRARIYFAAVCRCFPGKNPKGGDRVPDETEIANCDSWLSREFDILQPKLVIPVGKLAISKFMDFSALAEVIGHTWSIDHGGVSTEMIPLPHPSGASTWHRMEPGKTLLGKSLDLLARHPAFHE
jgi:uracil-DNA glycosylase